MIGNKIRELRRNLKLTQSELAKKLGVSSAAVALWETNKREPDNKKLIELANCFGVSTDYLLRKDVENLITIMGSNGSFKQFELSEKKIKSIEIMAESLADNEENKLDSTD